jgi:carboxyl-terminal processing protease
MHRLALILLSLFSCAYASAQNNEVTEEELRIFTTVFARIKSTFVEPVGNKKLIEGAISGMVAALDPHSAYLSAEEYQALKESSSGKFGGLGFEVSMENGLVKVVSPIDDTPAHRAGILPGDLIVRIDDTPVKGLLLTDAVKKMRGEPGKPVRLMVVRDGVATPIQLKLLRAIINVKSVKARLLDKHYGYLRISSFKSETEQELKVALEVLKKENGGALKGLVLDVRNNPGGLLDAAVSVSDAFLRSGTIVSMDGRKGNGSDARFAAAPDDLMDGAPIVVLINEGSASSSEIVAGALQDHKRAVIMGTQSFGKGSVQSVLPMQNGSALILTTARYFTPSGKSIQAEGITPDIVLPPVKLVPLKKEGIEAVKEADLSRHLDKSEGTSAKKIPASDVAVNAADDDYPLGEALSLLKGLNVLSRNQLSK